MMEEESNSNKMDYEVRLDNLAQQLHLATVRKNKSDLLNKKIIDGLLEKVSYLESEKNFQKIFYEEKISTMSVEMLRMNTKMIEMTRNSSEDCKNDPPINRRGIENTMNTFQKSISENNESSVTPNLDIKDKKNNDNVTTTGNKGFNFSSNDQYQIENQEKHSLKMFEAHQKALLSISSHLSSLITDIGAQAATYQTHLNTIVQTNVTEAMPFSLYSMKPSTLTNSYEQPIQRMEQQQQLQKQLEQNSLVESFDENLIIQSENLKLKLTNYENYFKDIFSITFSPTEKELIDIVRLQRDKVSYEQDYIALHNKISKELKDEKIKIMSHYLSKEKVLISSIQTKLQRLLTEDIENIAIMFEEFIEQLKELQTLHQTVSANLHLDGKSVSGPPDRDRKARRLQLASLRIRSSRPGKDRGTSFAAWLVSNSKTQEQAAVQTAAM